MEKINKIVSAAVAVITGAFASRFGVHLMVLCCLFVAIGMDFVTGCLSAKLNNGGLSSKAAVKGGIKKLMYVMAIGVGIIIDLLIGKSLLPVVSLKIPYIFPITMIIMLYLIFTELISLIENLDELGVKLPKYLKKLIQKAKDGIEKE